MVILSSPSFPPPPSSLPALHKPWIGLISLHIAMILITPHQLSVLGEVREAKINLVIQIGPHTTTTLSTHLAAGVDHGGPLLLQVVWCQNSGGRGAGCINVKRRLWSYMSISGHTCTNMSMYLYMVIYKSCLLYTSPSPRDRTRSRMPSSA